MVFTGWSLSVPFPLSQSYNRYCNHLWSRLTKMLKHDVQAMQFYKTQRATMAQQDPLTDVSVVRSLHRRGEGKGAVGWSHCSYCIPALTWEKWKTHILPNHNKVHVWAVRRGQTVKVIHPVYAHTTVVTSVLICHGKWIVDREDNW